MNSVVWEDAQKIISYNDVWKKLNNKTVFVSGATGLIGYSLITALIVARCEFNINVKIVALARNKDRIQQLYNNNIYDDWFETVIGDITSEIIYDKNIDYIVHTACPTDSRFFVSNPVETVDVIFNGTKNMLTFAMKKQLKAFIYLSSMEIYGFNSEEQVLTETDNKYLNQLEVRSCYPLGKRMAENLCVDFKNEYDIPIKIVRLAQTFGAGVKYDDNRVFAYFGKCAIENKDIVLMTNGLSKRMYVYTADAVNALIYILTVGKIGETYNVANKNTYCSIVDMAKMVINNIATENIKLTFNTQSCDKNKFSPLHNLYLDVTKIEKLGWSPIYDLKNMYLRMIKSWKS